MLRRLALVFFGALTSCEAPGDGALFNPDVTYDTIAVVGDERETNPLFIFSSPVALLLDDSTVVYTDGREHGRLVTANVVTGRGWEILSRASEDGPGEFGGEMPVVSPVDDLIHTITLGGAYNSFAHNGKLMAARRYEPPPWLSNEMTVVPVGIAGGRVVVKYIERFDRAGSPQQTLRQGIRIFDIDLGLVADVTDGIPGLVQRVIRVSDTSSRYESVSGDGLIVRARGETIVWAMHEEHRVTTLDPDGEVLASRELDERLWNVFIDADQRIIANVRARDAAGEPGIIMLNRTLEEEFRLAARYILDASGDALLGFQRDELGLIRLVLMRMRSAGSEFQHSG